MNIGDWVVFKTFKRQRNDTGYELVQNGWTYPINIVNVRDGFKGSKYVDGLMIGQPDDIKSKKIEDCRLATEDDFQSQTENVLRQSQELTEAYYQEKEKLEAMYSELKKEIDNVKRRV